MPDFNGTGPLRRGRIIGRGRGTCGRSGDEQRCKNRVTGDRQDDRQVPNNPE